MRRLLLYLFVFFFFRIMGIAMIKPMISNSTSTYPPSIKYSYIGLFTLKVIIFIISCNFVILRALDYIKKITGKVYFTIQYIIVVAWVDEYMLKMLRTITTLE